MLTLRSSPLPQVAFAEVLNACTSVVYSEIKESVESLSDAAKVVRDLKVLESQARETSFEHTEAKNNLVELHSVCTIQRRWRQSEKKRNARNMKARREAIRLRTPGTLVPVEFKGRVQHSTVAWGGRVFVFGGRADNRMLRDFWEFSINAGYWVDQSHTVPDRMRARCGHSAMLTGTSRMLIIGGHDGEDCLADVWECELNGLYWRQVGFAADEHPAKLQAPARIKAAEPPDSANGGDTSSSTNGADTSSSTSKSDPASHDQRARPTRLQLAAVQVLQAHARGRSARIAASWRATLADLEYDAASYVQAVWRGHVMRRRVEQRSPPE